MPINCTSIKNMASSLTTYQKGAAYQKNHRVTILEDKIEDGEKQAVSAWVLGSGGARYYVTVHMDLDGNILDGECDCPAFAAYSGFCKHIIAVLLQIMQEPFSQLVLVSSNKDLKKENSEQKPTIKTDSLAAELMRQYAQRAAVQAWTVPPEERAVLAPTLEFRKTGQVGLTFKIGVKRRYVLKNLSKFIEAMRTGAEVEYGKQFRFRHLLCNFEENSRPFVRYVLEQYHESDKNSFQYGSYYGSPEVDKYMPLSPFMLDEFMKLCVGKEVQMEVEDQPKRAAVREENPELNVTIAQVRAGGFELRLDAGLWVLYGANRIYVLRDGLFYCCDQAYSTICADFLKAMLQSGNRLVIDKSNMKAMVSTVLSEIKPYIKIDSNCDLSTYEPNVLGKLQKIKH